MRPKSLILLAMALGCGLVAAVGINQIMARPSGDAVETTSIVVAKREILKGDLIKPDDIRLQEWRKDSLPDGAIEKIEDLQDKRVRTTIFVGEPLLGKKLVDGKDEGGIEIPPGMKAVTVKVDDVAQLGGLIKPGDNVDVLVHVVADTSKNIMATSTTRFLQNVKVLATDQVVERPAPGEPPTVAKTVTLLVSPRDAMRVTLASEIGNIRLIGRSAKDQGEVTADGAAGELNVTVNDVLRPSGSSAPAAASSGPALPPGITPLPPITHEEGVGDQIEKGFTSLGDLLKEMQNARDNGPPPEKKTWKVLLIEGAEAKEVEFAPGARLARAVGGGLGPASGSPATPAAPVGAPVSLGLPTQGEDATAPSAGN